MKKVLLTLATGIMLAACHKSNNNNVLPQATAPGSQTQAAQKGVTGVATAEPAYYDHVLFKINLKVQPDNAGASLIAHNKSINNIYRTEGPDETELFVAVLDAINTEHGPGFNPLWQEQLITFNPGHTPHQFFSDNEVLDAQASGEITLTASGEVYRCSVIGKP